MDELALHFSKRRPTFLFIVSVIGIGVASYVILSVYVGILPILWAGPGISGAYAPPLLLYAAFHAIASGRRLFHAGPGLVLSSSYVFSYPYNGCRPVRWEDVTNVVLLTRGRVPLLYDSVWQLVVETRDGKKVRIDSDYFKPGEWDSIFSALHRFAPTRLRAEVPSRAPRGHGVSA